MALHYHGRAGSLPESEDALHNRRDPKAATWPSATLAHPPLLGATHLLTSTSHRQGHISLAPWDSQGLRRGDQTPSPSRTSHTSEAKKSVTLSKTQPPPWGLRTGDREPVGRSLCRPLRAPSSARDSLGPPVRIGKQAGGGVPGRAQQGGPSPR